MRRTMTEEEIRRVEEEIYRDLTPVESAARELAAKLPTDGRTLSDEAWHFFHFETDDYAAVKRAIERAVEDDPIKWGNRMPVLRPLEDQIRLAAEKLSPGTAGKAARQARTPRAEEILAEILRGEELDENRPLFLYFSQMDIGSGSGGQSDNSASRISSNRLLYEVMEAFLHYCAEERSMQSHFQAGNAEAYPERKEVVRYNRLFFVSYGSVCVLPDNLRGALCTISWPSLQAEDFKSLLWEYHLRKERYLKRKHEERGLPRYEIRALQADGALFSWYANRMAGLPEIQVRRLLASLDGAFAGGYADYADRDVVDQVIIRCKNEILRQHRRLEVIPVREQDRVTGLGTVQNWLEEHRDSIGSYEGSPSGILLVGIPGTGKSAAAKEAARRLQLPLVQLDMSRILGGRVGDSEKGMREMLEDLRFVAPCVLWIDEVEKAMSGADGKSGDGGTIRRLFGMLLTFIQDNDRPVFTVTTANDISKLPPEFFRNGRFNQTFCLLMPDYGECRAIMRLKLNQYPGAEWGHEFPLNEAGAILDQCLGTPEAPRFLTGADIEAHAQELLWHYRARGETRYPKGGIEDLKAVMREIAGKVRAQGTPAARHTMEEIAEQYLDMMRRGLTIAGDPETPYRRENLDTDRIRFYNFESDPAKDRIPLCMAEPRAFTPYRDCRKIPETDRNAPSRWYDARFFYELVPVMSERIFLDPERTMPETRAEYWKLRRAMNQRGTVTK